MIVIVILFVTVHPRYGGLSYVRKMIFRHFDNNNHYYYYNY